MKVLPSSEYPATPRRATRLHDPAMIADPLIDRSTLTTASDADRAVAAFAQTNLYMRSEPERIAVTEQERIWGQQILDALDRS